MAARPSPKKVVTLTASNAIQQAAEILRTLSHPHRLRIVQLLLQGRYTVGDLAAACDISSAMTSEHVRLMQRSGLLTGQREGRRIFYHVSDPFLAPLIEILETRFGVEPTSVRSSG